MQLIKCELLKNSIDESVRKIYKAREEINSKFTRVWRASNIAKTASAEVELDLKFPTQSTQQGLGFGNFNPHPSVSEKRNCYLPRPPHLESTQESLMLQLFQGKESVFNGQRLLFLLIFLGKILFGEMSMLTHQVCTACLSQLVSNTGPAQTLGVFQRLCLSTLQCRKMHYSPCLVSLQFLAPKQKVYLAARLCSLIDRFSLVCSYCWD